ADRDDSGAIVSSGSVNAFQMRVGDCFDDGSTFTDDEVDHVPGVPCAQPHDNEVYAVFDVGMTSFPGEQMGDLAQQACIERFEAFVGKDYESSSLDVASLYPTSESWHGQNDREVICAVYDLEQKKLAGTVKGLRL
ncbi:MAG TPA: septum formation family protein, partial [Gammaproteobacteria bacterium]|nr:septum formation family protein [Gammaproteobacteria bacterium]